jgi:CheY-like chemotaxis protein
MAINGPILIVDDDPDDQEMIGRILKKMDIENEIKNFLDGERLLEYLRTTDEKPFIIICDINMPIMNGLQLKEAIEKDLYLRKKSIPFVYLSTTANPQQVRKAYELTVQGFFVKGQSYDALKNAITQIISYWKTSVHIDSTQ